MNTEIKTLRNNQIVTVTVNLYEADKTSKFLCSSCAYNYAGNCQKRMQVWTCATYPKIVPFHPKAKTQACSSFEVGEIDTY